MPARKSQGRGPTGAKAMSKWQQQRAQPGPWGRVVLGQPWPGEGSE